jgi:hypothetical protein
MFSQPTFNQLKRAASTTAQDGLSKRRKTTHPTTAFSGTGNIPGPTANHAAHLEQSVSSSSSSSRIPSPDAATAETFAMVQQLDAFQPMPLLQPQPQPLGLQAGGLPARTTEIGADLTANATST